MLTCGLGSAKMEVGRREDSSTERRRGEEASSYRIHWTSPATPWKRTWKQLHIHGERVCGAKLGAYIHSQVSSVLASVYQYTRRHTYLPRLVGFLHGIFRRRDLRLPLTDFSSLSLPRADA